MGMLRRIPWAQFVAWKVYDEIDPIGGKRGDWQAASICAAVMNAAMITSRGNRRFRVSDFMIGFSEKQKPVEEVREGKSWQEMRFIAQMMTAQANTKRGKR